MNNWNASSGTRKISRKNKGDSKTEYGNKALGFSWRFEGVKGGIPKNIKSSIFAEGYPAGLMLNIVGPPKAGKTIFCLQEAIEASVRGEDVLYITNERGREYFDLTIDKARNRLGYSVGNLKNIEFVDKSEVISKVAQLNAIEQFMQSRYIRPIEDHLYKFNTKMIVIDSLSKAIRTFPAQAYWAVQMFIRGVKDAMIRTGKRPVVLIINQKSGGGNQRNDETVLGGYGCVHDMDGNIVLRMNPVDKWLARDTGLRIGSILHTVQIMEIRDTDADTDERFIEMKDGRLVVGDTMWEVYAKNLIENSILNSDATTVNKDWSNIQ